MSEEYTHHQDPFIKVYVTTNYAMFTPNPANRPIDEKRVLEIVDDILEGYDYMADNPITVDENLMIIKGHHRHAAASLAGVKLYYTIRPGMTIQDAIREQERTKDWNTLDHLNRYANMGMPSYVKIRDFWKEYPWLTITGVLRLTSVTGHHRRDFRAGIFKADRLLFARMVAEMAQDFKAEFKYWNSTTFLNAVMQLCVQPGYAHARMLRKMGYQSSKLTRQATVQQYLVVLSDIYNYRESADNHLYFRKYIRLFTDADAKK